jgi:hypothetical protein
MAVPSTACWAIPAILTAAVAIVQLQGSGQPTSPVETQGRTVSGQPPAARGDACAQPANKVVAENCKPGNDYSEWDINGAGDPSIQGFATDISANVGETVSFKVKTPSPKYRIDIYRLGYYGGKGARKLDTVQPIARLPQAQPDCFLDTSTRLHDCGNWAVSASWSIPATATSGVYIARLVREDGDKPTWRADNSQFAPKTKPPAAPHAYGASGKGQLGNAIKEPRASHVYFIVRDDAGNSEMLFQTSDQAWQAYNRYGWVNTYRSYIPGGMQVDQITRAYKVSYNRPYVNRDFEWQNTIDQVFNAEYPMIRWLERNGYDVSYFSGVDSARRGADIKKHKIFLSVGHDEYWSGEQRKHVEAARDAGVNLAFFSGNEVFWKIRHEASPVDAAPYRTVVTYKETHSGAKIDPQRDVWTGTWRDSSPWNPEGAQPENALMGVIFTVNAWRNDPLVVPAKYASHRFWRNTEVATLKAGEQVVLGDGILGHEWDEDIDNGFRPAGLVHLSETVVDNVQYIQDHGTVYDTGTATHRLTLYKAKSGALVFGAGTVQWSWGLDNFHDNWNNIQSWRANRYSIRLGTDPNGPVRALQQATVNLFADMGVQPANLQDDLTPATRSTDSTSPISNIVSPSDGMTLSGRTVAISGTARDEGGGVVANIEVSTDGGRTWHPAEGMSRWTYAWQVPPGVTETVLMSRAADDSANLESPRGGVRVRLGQTFTSRDQH